MIWSPESLLKRSELRQQEIKFLQLSFENKRSTPEFQFSGQPIPCTECSNEYQLPFTDLSSCSFTNKSQWLTTAKMIVHANLSIQDRNRQKPKEGPFSGAITHVHVTTAAFLSNSTQSTPSRCKNRRFTGILLLHAATTLVVVLACDATWQATPSRSVHRPPTIV